MITLTRRQARCLRGVFRRSVLGIARTGPDPAPGPPRPAAPNCARSIGTPHLAVEHAAPGRAPSAGSIALPLEALADFEGRDEAPVVLEAVAPDRTVVRWADRGVPQSREYAVPPLDRWPRSPSPPRPGSCPAELLAALAEATATGTEATPGMP